jgi:glycosyltransferase involved in cell wall biosynthesis
MSYGVPVIASNRMSVPEVAGDAALIVDPDNIKALAEAMHKMIIDEKLREYLVKKGYKRVEYFSWEKAAKKTLAVFENVYKNDKGLG